MKLRTVLYFFTLCTACSLLSRALFGCQEREFYTDKRVMMGTFIEVTSQDRRAGQIVFSEFGRIENLLSKYKAESEVSRLNRLGELAVSPETFFVIGKAKEFWQKSGGAFDITVGPLDDLWGFTQKDYRLPQEAEVRKTLKRIGSDKIVLNSAANVVKFSLPGMKIDLGAIAKGYALDCAVKRLRENNITSCLISAGGQVYCLGEKSGRPWRVGIKGPENSGMAGYLDLKDKCVSTSADYEQYFKEGGKVYGHIFDPRTGYPADKGIASVSVVSPDGLTADALSSAIFILGEEKGLELAKKLNISEVRIIKRPGT
ncbi:MAG: FAD:protein FMN transferase [Candidatus Omnitrophica bacterium]|nr:FAD:protein FMN transferase [Candidatus Omnitrophota bacterium]